MKRGRKALKRGIVLVMVFILALSSFGVPEPFGGIFPVEVSARASGRILQPLDTSITKRPNVSMVCGTAAAINHYEFRRLTIFLGAKWQKFCIKKNPMPKQESLRLNWKNLF